MPTPPKNSLTTDDQKWLRVIAVIAQTNRDSAVSLIREYYRNADRADRTPREVLYFHLGLLTGIAERHMSQ